MQRLPLLAIEPVADEAGVAARLRQAHGWDHWIFTSANAAHQAARLDAGPWPPLAAAGAATAVALAGAGHAGALVPAGLDGAAGLLADARFAAPAGQRILIVTGDNTLPQLAEGLRARGAKVEVLAVYRRVPVPHAPQAVADAIAASRVAIVSSGEALAHLLQVPTPPAARTRLLSLGGASALAAYDRKSTRGGVHADTPAAGAGLRRGLRGTTGTLAQGLLKQ